jgi:hypothetical protein
MQILSPVSRRLDSKIPIQVVRGEMRERIREIIQT